MCERKGMHMYMYTYTYECVRVCVCVCACVCAYVRAASPCSYTRTYTTMVSMRQLPAAVVNMIKRDTRHV